METLAVVAEMYPYSVLRLSGSLFHGTQSASVTYSCMEMALKQLGANLRSLYGAPTVQSSDNALIQALENLRIAQDGPPKRHSGSSSGDTALSSS